MHSCTQRDVANGPFFNLSALVYNQATFEEEVRDRGGNAIVTFLAPWSVARA